MDGEGLLWNIIIYLHNLLASSSDPIFVSCEGGRRAKWTTATGLCVLTHRIKGARKNNYRDRKLRKLLLRSIQQPNIPIKRTTTILLPTLRHLTPHNRQVHIYTLRIINFLTNRSLISEYSGTKAKKLCIHLLKFPQLWSVPLLEITIWAICWHEEQNDDEKMDDTLQKMLDTFEWYFFLCVNMQ